MDEQYGVYEGGGGSEDWCDISRSCAVTNSTVNNTKCPLPFCPTILSYSINNSSVRVYDLVLLFFSLVFLSYLIICLAATMKKLNDSLPLFRLLYFMMFLIPIMSCAYEVTSLAAGYKSDATKVLHLFLRGSILMTELSVVTFGLFIKLCGSSAVKLSITIAAIIGVSLAFTAVEGVLEFTLHSNLACESFNFFTHGGMIFLFSTSVIFTIAYGTIFLVYILGLYKRWNLPTKKSFYRYALFLSLVNIIQAVGSFLWFSGRNSPASGNAGICLTVLANVIYVVTFAPVVYWIFLSNYFRMNSTLLKSSVEASNSKINDISSDIEASQQKKSTSTNPLDIGRKKRGLFADHTSLIAESYETSSSYGSLDEETFVRQGTPDK